MGLLVEYTVKDDRSSDQVEALQTFVAGLKAIGDGSFSYTAYETDDPTRFIAVFEFDDESAKQRFLQSAAFAEYREGAKDRFVNPPQATPIQLVASTRD